MTLPGTQTRSKVSRWTWRALSVGGWGCTCQGGNFLSSLLHRPRVGPQKTETASAYQVANEGHAQPQPQPQPLPQPQPQRLERRPSCSLVTHSSSNSLSSMTNCKYLYKPTEKTTKAAAAAKNCRHGNFCLRATARCLDKASCDFCVLAWKVPVSLRYLWAGVSRLGWARVPLEASRMLSPLRGAHQTQTRSASSSLSAAAACIHLPRRTTLWGSPTRSVRALHSSIEPLSNLYIIYIES